MAPWKRVLIGILLFGAIIVLSNIGFFVAYVRFWTSPPPPISVVQEGSPTSTPAEPNQLAIKRLGIFAPVLYVDRKNETDFQAALKNGVVHYPGTAMPGELGNVYIFGHSSDYFWSKSPYKTIFALLPEIHVGDEIQLSNASGTVFTYLVTGTKIVFPDDLTVLDQQGRTKKLLTLQTSYPLGTALRRYLVFAEATSTR